jgi:CheY-like chemotaxis protein
MGEGTVLLVDDEEMILDVGRQMLERLGYEVLVARSGIEALTVFKEHIDQIDLVILDLIMPDMGGGESFDRLREMDPDVKVLLSSGYSENGQAKEILKRGCRGFIQKPFDLNNLAMKVQEVLAKGPDLGGSA